MVSGTQRVSGWKVKGGRKDANRRALEVARLLLEAAHDFVFEVEGTRVEVRVGGLVPPPWPRRLHGLNERRDGPWPTGTRLFLRWEGGSTELEFRAVVAPPTARLPDAVQLLGVVPTTRQEVLTVPLARSLLRARDDRARRVTAHIGLARRKGETNEFLEPRGQRLLELIKHRELPLRSTWRVTLLSATLPWNKLAPNAEQCFERVAQMALLRLPFLLRNGEEGITGRAPFATLADDVAVESTVARIVADATAHRSAGATSGALPALDDPGASQSLTVGSLTAEAEAEAGMWPLPGGIRHYKRTLDEVLGWIAEQPRGPDELEAMMAEHYQIAGKRALLGYRRLLRSTGLIDVEQGCMRLSEAGQSYLDAPSSQALFEVLHKAFIGLLETLVVIESGRGLGLAETQELLEGGLKLSWQTEGEPAVWRNWLLSLGLTKRNAEGDVITPLGRRVLDCWPAEVTGLRQLVEEALASQESRAVSVPNLVAPSESAIRALAEEGPQPAFAPRGSARPFSQPGQEPAPVAPVGPPSHPASRPALLSSPPLPPPARPPGPGAPRWKDERLDLGEDEAAASLGGLMLPEGLLPQAVAALSAGKHLLLVGPPGTGKTELAAALADAARREGYCRGLHTVTTSADWTSFEVVGGYALGPGGGLHFRPGALLRAIEQQSWLLLDELNRGDMDRAFGELMTVLAGRASQTGLQLPDGRLVSIGPEPEGHTHHVPPPFRVLATMNSWDRTSLFRLSYALQRRFAVLFVGPPGIEQYAQLIEDHASGPGLDPVLPVAAIEQLHALFADDGVMAQRPIGPAVALDMVRYMRRRQHRDALAEAVSMFLLPQLEGLDRDDARHAWEAIDQAVFGICSDRAVQQLWQRYADLFPLLGLSDR